MRPPVLLQQLCAALRDIARCCAGTFLPSCLRTAASHTTTTTTHPLLLGPLFAQAAARAVGGAVSQAAGLASHATRAAADYSTTDLLGVPEFPEGVEGPAGGEGGGVV